MKKNLTIGITSRVENISEFNDRRDALSHEWSRIFNELNVIPIFIPNYLKNLDLFLEKFDFDLLILSGGDNIGDSKERDHTEKRIIDYSIKEKIPVLGICRGMQVLNNFFSGTLEKTFDKKHVATRHTINFLNPLFTKEFQNSSIDVNSFHNNIIKHENLGKNLEVFSIYDNDETIEGFFHKSYYMLGVMWHPERESNILNAKILIKILLDKKVWKSN